MTLLLKTLFFTVSLLVAEAAWPGSSEANATLKPFYTDGCTFFTEGTLHHPQLWAHCCFEHDLRYWFGGSKAQRLETDRYLKRCVADVAGKFWADLIYTGVRWGHLSPIKSSTFWGWGWTPKKIFSPLTPEEIQYVEDQLEQLPLDSVYRERFIDRYLRL